jgi:hypothetical protein
MAEKNSTIMASVWLEATNDFQQRIPNPTVQGIDATLGALFDPLNNDMWNYFVNALVMRIGMVRVRNQEYKNPLREFKGATMQYGHTIQEIAPKWIKGHAYSQASTLLDVNAPEAQEWFHSRNRQDMYPISINEVELRQSFDSEYGLSSLVAGFLNAPMNADEYDEYRIMLELIAYYEKHWGFYTVDLDNDPLTTEAGGKELLKQVRTLTGKMKVPSSRYNANVIDIPVFVSDPSELMLITIPECEANLDVEVLASLFHVEMADIDVRRIVVDEMPIPNACALLTTRDFFVCHDTFKGMRSFQDGSNLTTNYWLHHQGIYSVSPFVPAILFTYGGTSTVTPTVTIAVTGVDITPATATVEPGKTQPLNVQLQGTLTGSPATVDLTGLGVRPNAVTWDIAADFDLNNRTWIDNKNVLHLQKTGATKGGKLTLTGTASYINPSGATQTYTDTVAITVG